MTLDTKYYIKKFALRMDRINISCLIIAFEEDLSATAQSLVHGFCRICIPISISLSITPSQGMMHIIEIRLLHRIQACQQQSLDTTRCNDHQN
jgi:hypothetical protein